MMYEFCSDEYGHGIKITSYDDFFMINIGKLKKLEFMNCIIYFVSIILKKMD